ncbi:F-box/kelch-repeat protein At3g61590 [Linum perenne]
MKGEASWFHPYTDVVARDGNDIKSFSNLNDDDDDEDYDVNAVSMDMILPDDLLERILAYLPIASIFRAGSVSKRWHEIVSSRRFLWNFSPVTSQKPWYFMFTSSDDPVGYAFDPVLRKWYGIDLPCVRTSNWFVTSSCGLVCFMDNDSRSELYACNPITKCFRKLEGPPGSKLSDYSALAVSVNRVSHNYTISIVKSKQVPRDFLQWDFAVYTYSSDTRVWRTCWTEVLAGWRGGDESVICDGNLYVLIYSTSGAYPENRHGLLTYKLSGRYSRDEKLINGFIPTPCPLTCGRLMNLKDKLVMVGGIGKHVRPDVIKGIGIWVLNGREWQEIARMPHKYFQGFGELDDVFASSGTDNLIYIQSYGGPSLLVFDMNHKQWKWSQKCPVTKRFPLQLFTGFCFEPRLEIAP